MNNPVKFPPQPRFRHGQQPSAVVISDANQIRKRADAQFIHDSPFMARHGFLADAQKLTRLLTGEAIGQ